MSIQRQALIQLAVPEPSTVGPGLPAMTHAKLVHLEWELIRAQQQKPGWIDTWWAKGYLYEGQFYESAGEPGVHDRADTLEEMMPVIVTPLVQGETNDVAISALFCDFILLRGALVGTRIFIGVNPLAP